MKKLIVALMVLSAGHAWAQQQPELPSLSPAAKVSQVVGLTEVGVEYSSPAVRGRTIWGALVPYGEVWRAGANRATKVTFGKDVTIGTTVVPAGSYAVFMIPTKAQWTVIFNKDFNQGGTANYKKELDAVRIDVKPEAIALQENLQYNFPSFSSEQGVLAMSWEKVRVGVPFKVGTDAQVTAALESMEKDAWVPYNRAARYELEQKKNYDLGLKYAEASLKMSEQWFNTWTKAQLLAAKGNYKDAQPLAQKAQTLGEKNPQGFFYADEVKAAVKEWKAKNPS